MSHKKKLKTSKTQTVLKFTNIKHKGQLLKVTALSYITKDLQGHPQKIPEQISRVLLSARPSLQVRR